MVNLGTHDGWCPSPLDLFRLCAIVHNDRLPERRPDAIYLFGTTPDNEYGVLQSVNLLLDRYSKTGEEFPVYVCGGEQYRPPDAGDDAPIAYSGFTAWRDWLVERAFLDEEDIHVVPQPRLAHTRTEAEAVMRIAADKKWSSIIIIAAHLHILRGFTNAVMFATRLCPDLRVYARAGLPPQSWRQDVLSSQGTVHGSIMDVCFAAEWERLNRYHAKGDLIAACDVLDYISHRDSGGSALA